MPNVFSKAFLAVFSHNNPDSQISSRNDISYYNLFSIYITYCAYFKPAINLKCFPLHYNMKRHYKVWTPEEAQRLSEAVKYVVRKYGAIQWDKVAGMVPERNIWQCKSFYASNIKKTKTEQINQLLKPYQNMPILVIPNEWAS